LYKLRTKLIITSALTGALFFWNCTVSGRSETIISDSFSHSDSVLLVNNDSTITEKTLPNPKFTETDSRVKVVNSDSIILKEHSPKKAGMYSALIPGLGQAYNNKYWKIPILYVGEGLMVYYAVQQQNFYKDYTNLYKAEYFKPPGEQNADSLTIYGIRRDGYRQNRDKLFFFAGLIYAANIIDAMVDAYFYHFDISDNLSMKLQPALNYPVLAMGNISYGFKLSLKF
jgi:hypothetical protein